MREYNIIMREKDGFLQQLSTYLYSFSWHLMVDPHLIKTLNVEFFPPLLCHPAVFHKTGYNCILISTPYTRSSHNDSVCRLDINQIFSILLPLKMFQVFTAGIKYGTPSNYIYQRHLMVYCCSHQQVGMFIHHWSISL